MLIDNPATVVGAAFAIAAMTNIAMLKLSPGIGARIRHTLAAVTPSIAVLGGHIGLNDSVVATGGDLLALGGAVAVGLAGAIISTGYVSPKRAISRG